jgi:peptide/nickel transport system substrate-binding protein
MEERVRFLKMVSGFAAVCAGIAAIHPQFALSQDQSNRIVVADLFAPQAAFALETDDATILTRAGCLETLTRINFDGALEPSLATAWTQVEGPVWDFTLRDGVKFHDGGALTGEAAASALRKLLAVAAPARAFSPRLIKSVEAVGTNKVRITAADSSVLLPYRLASPNTGILSPAAYEGGKINPVGTCTGAFIIREIVPQQALKLVRNPAYWGGQARIGEAEVRFIPDGNVRATQARTGEAQIGRIVPVASRRALAQTSGIRLTAVDVPRTTALYLNNKKPPFNDPRVRQAVQAALDVSAITQAIYEGGARPAIGPFAPGRPWAPASAATVAASADRAKALLAQAGVQAGTLKLGLLGYTERPELKDLATVIQDQLKQTGIQVDIRIAAYAAVEPDMLAGNYDMALLSRGHLADIGDPIGFLTADYTCSGTYNISQYCNADTDALVGRAATMLEIDARIAIYRQVAQKLQAEAVNVFIVHEQQIDAVSERVQNFRMHPLGHHVLTAALALAPR